MSLLGSLLKKTNAGPIASTSQKAKPNNGVKRKLTSSQPRHDAPGPSDADSNGAKMTKLQPNAAQAAYMGPSLWDEVLTFNECSSLELLNADDFLLETGLLTHPKIDESRGILHSTLPSTSSSPNPMRGLLTTRSPPTSIIASDTLSEPSPKSSVSSSWGDVGGLALGSDGDDTKKSKVDALDTDVLQKLLQGCSIPNAGTGVNVFDNDFIIDEQEEEAGESADPDIRLSSAELHLATAPGERVFDPKNRKFECEELRPMPVLRKAKKQYVPEEKKDEKYWERRRKNNVAAKRARDAQRIKMNQIMIRTAWLESENEKLRDSLDVLKQEKEELKDRLRKYEPVDDE